jgi:hypothetical protein
MKNMMLKTTLGLFGMLLLSSGARAQTTAFDVSAASPTDGDWHVVVVETGNAFTINVTTTTPTPASEANQVQVTFLDTANNPVTAVNGGGGTVGAGGGAWNNVANGNTVDWKWNVHLLPVHDLQPNGSNFFLGTGTLAPLPGDPAESVDVTVFDSAHGPWTATEELTPETFVPEASSLALLLPGLIPMGIALRRRRKTRA